MKERTLGYECAVIHSNGRLLRKGFSALSRSKEKVLYQRGKREYFTLFKVFRAWLQWKCM